MAKRELRIVVASPGDVQAERDLMPQIVEEVNQGVGKAKNIRFELSRWETDSHPGFHPEGPQGLVDQVLGIEECDLLIGIFWKRFGTPVSDAGSGTEHEFLTAYRSWQRNGQKPQIMVYFNEQPAWPSSAEEIAQWAKVLDFRKKFPKEGLWWTYQGKAQFEPLVRRHLTQFVLELPDAAPAAPPRPAAPPPSGNRTAGSGAVRATQAMDAREEELRRMQVRAIVLQRRLNDLKDRRERGRIDEGRYQDLTGDLEREHIEILLELQKHLTDQDGEIDEVLRDAVKGVDHASLADRLAAALEKRQLAPALVAQLKQHRGFLAASLIEASLALAREVDGSSGAPLTPPR